MDNQSIISNIVNSNIINQLSNINENIKNFGRVACIKMKNEFDALVLLTGKIQF